jgi:hypothetical protein
VIVFSHCNFTFAMPIHVFCSPGFYTYLHSDFWGNETVVGLLCVATQEG